MTERHSKTIFSAEELRCIIALVRELETATASKQKGIRAKIRKIGLYWSEVASGADYTVANLQRLFEILRKSAYWTNAFFSTTRKQSAVFLRVNNEGFMTSVVKMCYRNMVSD